MSYLSMKKSQRERWLFYDLMIKLPETTPDEVL